jgi:AcrR family transcriptional regulator
LRSRFGAFRRDCGRRASPYDRRPTGQHNGRMPEPDTAAITMTLRDTLLQRSREYMLTHGIVDLSLSQLARGVASSNRMLLYHFGSLRGLISEVVSDILTRTQISDLVFAPLEQSGVPVRERLARAWVELAAPDQRRVLTLFFSYFGLVLHRPDADDGFMQLVRDDWVERLEHAIADEVGAEWARECAPSIVALWRGLQMALLSGMEPHRVDVAHDRAVDALLAGAAG